MVDQNARRIFLSHTHRDNSFVEQLAADIEEAGVECWLDLWDLSIGDSLTKRIESAIAAADWLLVVLSQASVESAWVRQELTMAFIRELEGRSIFILPVLMEPCEIPLSLRDKVYADFTNDYGAGLRAVLGRVRNLSPAERRSLRRLARYCRECDDQLPLLSKLIATVCDAGLPLLDGLRLIGEELAGPLRAEVLRMTSELTTSTSSEGGQDWYGPVMQLRKRVPTERMHLFTAMWRIGSETGMLDHLFRNLSFDGYPSGRLTSFSGSSDRSAWSTPE